MDDPMLTAKRLFDREHCHHAIVLERNRVFGVVSDRDILKVVSPFAGNAMMERSQDLNTLKKRIHQIMSRELVTIGPDETVATAAGKMLRERVSCLPVVDDTRSLLGIVTIRDFLAWAVGTSAVHEEPSGEFEHDKGILIIIDGTRCYSPDVAIGRLIRAAERSYEENYGAGSACAKCLPNPQNEVVVG
jgi:acetoin utilization protein AcuB